jgi:hypothetical protein
VDNAPPQEGGSENLHQINRWLLLFDILATQVHRTNISETFWVAEEALVSGIDGRATQLRLEASQDSHNGRGRLSHSLSAGVFSLSAQKRALQV